MPDENKKAPARGLVPTGAVIFLFGVKEAGG